MKEWSEVPSDSILLGDGTVWKVPPYPGGLSEKAVRARAASDALDVKVRTRLDVWKMLEIERKEAGEDAEALAEVARKESVNDKDWTDDMLGEGWEFLMAMRRLQTPTTDEEGWGLFPVGMIVKQVLRARTACRGVSKPPLDEVSRPDPTSTNTSTSGLETGTPTPETATGG